MLNALRRKGTPWRVLNLSRSGAQTRHVLEDQLPLLDGLTPALVTCGIGNNDILATPPKRFRDRLRQVIDGLPSSSVVMDLTVPDRFWRIGGAVSPYVSGIDQLISDTATSRGLPVAEVSRYARPPWRGMLAPDAFHPNNLGYRRHADALLAALPQKLLRRSSVLPLSCRTLIGTIAARPGTRMPPVRATRVPPPGSAATAMPMIRKRLCNQHHPGRS